VHDRDGGQKLLTGELKGDLPRLAVVWADAAYTGHGSRNGLGESGGWHVEVHRHPDRQLWRYGLEQKARGFLVLPRWWVVERTVAWLDQARGASPRTTRGCRKPRWS
jgi:transposase